MDDREAAEGAAAEAGGQGADAATDPGAEPAGDFKRPYLTRRSLVGGAVAAAAVAAGVAVGVSRCDKGEEDVPAEPAAQEEDASSKKLGGKMTLYTCCDEALVNAFVPAFMQQTNVVVDVVQRSAAACRDEAAAEVAGGIAGADVVWGGDAGWYAAGSECFARYLSGENSGVIKDCRNTDGYATPLTREVCVIAINPSQVKQLGVTIDGYESLTDERFAGWLAVSDPTTDAMAKTAAEELRAAGDALPAYATTDDEGNVTPGGEAFLSAVWAQAGGNVRATSADAIQDVVDGAAAAAIVYEQAARSAEAETSQVEVVYPKEGCAVALGCSAVVRGATNLEQAKAWIDFACSEAGQKAAAEKVCLRSIREGVGETSKIPGAVAGDAAVASDDAAGGDPAGGDAAAGGDTAGSDAAAASASE